MDQRALHTMPKRRGAPVAKASPNYQEGGSAFVELHPDDILVGRGFQFEGNPGNAVFQEMIETSVGRYNAASTRKDKTDVVRSVYEELSQASRFVRLDSATGLCTICSAKEAKQKVSHALRYRCQLEADAANESDDKKPAATRENEEVLVSALALEPNQAHPSVEATISIQREVLADETIVDSGIKRQKTVADTDDDSSMFSSCELESVLGFPHEYTTGSQKPQTHQNLEQTRSTSYAYGFSQVDFKSQSEPQSLWEPSERLRHDTAIRVGEDPLPSLEDDSLPEKDADIASFDYTA